MKRLLLFVVAALLVMARRASANSLSMTKPENVGMSSRRLARIVTSCARGDSPFRTPCYFRVIG